MRRREPPTRSAAPAAGPAQLPRGQIAENVVHFVRVLRAAGLPVGPAHTLDAQHAVEAVGVADRRRLPRALCRRAGLAREQLSLFEQAFDLFWRDPRLLQRMLALLSPAAQVADDASRSWKSRARIAQAMLPPPRCPSARPRRRGRARAGAHVFAARGAAEQGLRDDDRRRARRGEGAARADSAAAAGVADAPHAAARAGR